MEPTVSVELKKISELFGVNAPDSQVVHVTEPSFDTPQVDPNHVFTEDVVRRLQMWWSGEVKPSILVDGPTGCGKTTVFEQWAARVGADFYMISCHGKLDMADLIGQKELTENGTEFRYGIGVKALHSPRPCILHLDEVNFVSPGSIGLFNRITELKPFMVPETGEWITPKPWVRISAAGNAIARDSNAADYRGTQSMNLALRNRFLGMRMDYLPMTEEAKLLHAIVPGLHVRLIEKLVELSNDLRTGYAQGSLGVVMSTRSLIDIAKVLLKRKTLVAKNPVKEVDWAIAFCLTDLGTETDRQVVSSFVKDKLEGVVLSPSSAGTTPKPSAANLVQDDDSDSHNTEINFWVHPDRGPNGATFWGYTEGPHGVRSFNGNVADATVRDCEARTQSWIQARIREKEGKGYLRVNGPCGVTLSSPDKEEARDAISRLTNLIKDGIAGHTISIPKAWSGFITSVTSLLQ